MRLFSSPSTSDATWPLAVNLSKAVSAQLSVPLESVLQGYKRVFGVGVISQTFALNKKNQLTLLASDPRVLHLVINGLSSIGCSDT
jgi:hypothetical protein